MKLILSILALWSISSTALEFDQSVPLSLQKAILEDLEFLYQVRTRDSSPLHKEIFGEADGSVYKEFIESRVKYVGLNECGGIGAVACTFPFIEEHKIYLTPDYVKYGAKRASRLNTIIHEARHLEYGFGWPHETCPTPFLDELGADIVGSYSRKKLEGKDGCDWSVYGPYGIVSILFNNLAKFCTNCGPEFLLDAQAEAKSAGQRVVDLPDIPNRPKLALDFEYPGQSGSFAAE